MNLDELKDFIVWWNKKFPYDYWWRKKHNIAFLSPEHREISLIAQRMEYEEDKMYEELLKNKEEYVPNTGDFLKASKNNDTNISEFIKKQRKALGISEE